MPYAVTGLVGASLDSVVKAADQLNADKRVTLDNALGQQAWGNDGKLYVFGRANASIAASTAVCTVSPTTFLVTATGGAYLSPATALVTGDYAWFSKASV